jgi:hypothetical protein
MNDVTNRVDATAAAPPAGAQPTPAAEASPRFQQLLERLQKLTAEQPKAEDVDTPETLQQALRTADDGFVAAMDLRRQLEAAFQKHMS